MAHHARRAMTPALWVSVAGAAAFTVFAGLTTQDHAVRAGGPWQNDPYDGVVSFTEFLVPALTALILVRASLLRGHAPQPVFRLTQLLRAAFASTLLVAATVITDWLALALRADRPLWNDGLPWLVAALALVTATAAAGLVLQWRVFRRLPPGDPQRPGGDWLDDLAVLLQAPVPHLPRTGRRLIAGLDRRAVFAFARRHIVAFAATAALASGLALTTAEAIGEHWTSPLLFVTATAIGAGGFFAFAMICDGALQITAPRARPTPRTRARRAARAAATTGALALPVSAVFRDTLGAALGHEGPATAVTRLSAITFTGASAAAVLAAGVSLTRTRPARRGMDARRGRRAWARRAFRTGTVLALVVVITAAGYTGLVAVRHTRPVTLPTPTGPYRVGRTAFDWTDPARTDPLAPRPGTARELAVWLWYPAAPGARGRRAPYAPGAWGRLHLGSLPGLGETDFGAVRAHALTGVPVAAGRFPVVVLEPGLGFAVPQYTTLAENLASHGYLVAGPTPTYSANLTVLHGHPVHATTAGDPPAFDATDLHTGQAAQAGDRLAGVWAADARFAASQISVLDRPGRLPGPFSGHVDVTRTAYLGHSFGGAAALEACRTDPHCAAAADIDGTQYGPVVHTGLGRPLLILASQDSCVTGTCRPSGTADLADRATARTLLTAGAGPAWCYQIEGSRHFNFSDYAAYYLAAPIRHLLALGPIDGHLGLRITNAYLAAFLDHTLQGRDEPLLTGKITPYPQVRAQRTPR